MGHVYVGGASDHGFPAAVCEYGDGDVMFVSYMHNRVTVVAAGGGAEPPVPVDVCDEQQLQQPRAIAVLSSGAVIVRLKTSLVVLKVLQLRLAWLAVVYVASGR